MRVAAPGAATHAEREIEAGVEAAAVGESVRLVDQHAHHVGFLGELAGARHVLGVQAERMAAALMVEDVARPCRLAASKSLAR